MPRNFSLSGLLRLRRLQETKAAGELSNANRQVQRRRSEHEAMRQELAGGESYPVDSDTLLALMASRAATRAGLRDMEAMLSAEQAEALSATQAHQAARAEVKALEKLEHRHVTELRAEDLAREQLILDDLTSTASKEGSRT